ncbi:hypothetical protein BC941DRAFT_79199 [Chlamydoabsidia padenii]|nr:hypothetical protein BC941DRAFT_79199 [Chlamydoabsidia padenii]
MISGLSSGSLVLVLLLFSVSIIQDRRRMKGVLQRRERKASIEFLVSFFFFVPRFKPPPTCMALTQHDEIQG